MAGKSLFAERALLNTLRSSGGTNITAGQRYLALLTAAPTDASTGTTIVEPTTGGYARQAISFAADPTGGEPSVLVNPSAITFGPNSAATTWPFTHFAVVDALSAGNVWYWGALATPRTIAQDESAQCAAGSLSLSEF